MCMWHSNGRCHGWLQSEAQARSRRRLAAPRVSSAGSPAPVLRSDPPKGERSARPAERLLAGAEQQKQATLASSGTQFRFAFLGIRPAAVLSDGRAVRENRQLGVKVDLALP